MRVFSDLKWVSGSKWISFVAGAGLLVAGFAGVSFLRAPVAQAGDANAAFDQGGIAALSQNAAFQQFTSDFWPKAKSKGVSWRLYKKVMQDLTPNPKVIELAGNQAEFKTPVWDYLAKRVSEARIEKGQEMLKEHGKLVQAIERRTGVDRHIILAIWGMETNYGGYKGNLSTIRSLATLAYTGDERNLAGVNC